MSQYDLSTASLDLPRPAASPALLHRRPGPEPKLPSRWPRFAPPEVTLTHRDDGAFVLRSRLALGFCFRCVGDWLEAWAEIAPQRTFLAERSADGFGWTTVSYQEARSQVYRLASGLLELGLSESTPLMLLSGNSIENALLQLAAMHVGIPVAPISPAYSAATSDRFRLKEFFQLLRPGAVFASDARTFGPALDDLVALCPVPTIVSKGVRLRDIPLDLLGTLGNRAAVDLRFGDIGPDSVAKILFTSGSTGGPKGIVNTQRMLTANQQMILQVWPFLRERPPVSVDWLPWSHTFGGNHNFFMILANGGSLYIDPGKPIPSAISQTIEALREVSPTVYFNVPRGFDALIGHLEEDSSLAERFFADLDLLFFAAAALPSHLWTRIERVAKRVRGESVCFSSAWGSTETAPLVTSVHFPIDGPGVLGLPVPGVELALAPVHDKLELRVKGPIVSPGSWLPGGGIVPNELDAFGFLPMGDAGKLADPKEPSRGVVFDGRIGENFKLSSGTWVHVGELRTLLVSSLAPLAQDVVIAGHDRSFIGILVVPSPKALEMGCAKALCQLSQLLTAHNLQQPCGSRRVERAAFTWDPLSVDRGEVTDKGYINQRATLKARVHEVESLFASSPSAHVVVTSRLSPS